MEPLLPWVHLHRLGTVTSLKEKAKHHQTSLLSSLPGAEGYWIRDQVRLALPYLTSMAVGMFSCDCVCVLLLFMGIVSFHTIMSEYMYVGSGALVN